MAGDLPVRPECGRSGPGSHEAAGGKTLPRRSNSSSVLRRDRTPFPVFDDIRPLGAKRDPALRAFFLEELGHPNMRIRAQAVQALGLLPKDDASAAVVQGLVKAGRPYGVI